MTFAAFTQLPDGQPIHLRVDRIIAVAETPDGARVFLTGGYSCEVSEPAAQVIAAISRSSEN